MIYSNTRVHGLKYKFVRVVHQFYQNDTQLCKKIGCETVCYIVCCILGLWTFKSDGVNLKSESCQ